ncbi:MAG TPA: aspartate-semialdehyde dehydrogenase [Actinomycetota bacterium]|nr:aspartate-semialdehyde dehydrogenase [Actinomycetota bacterium]
MKLPSAPIVAVVGATGAVGRVMLDILADRHYPASEVIAIASQRSAGKKIRYGNGTITVRALEPGVFDGIDLVLLDTPDDVAKEWAKPAVEAGAIVVDNSAAWRMDPDVPLIVPEANPEAVDRHNGIIANPNCATIGVVVPVAPLHKVYGLERMIVSTYQSTSGAGRGGVDELGEQSLKLAGEMDALAEGSLAGIAPEPQMFAASIGFNILPQIGSIKEDGSTSEELKMLNETRKILSLPDVEVITTCVRVPTVVGHGAAVHARFSEPLDFDEVTGILRHAPGVKMTDLPNAHQAAGTDPCYVGRVRRDPFDPNSVSFFTVSDNLRKGAALNAVQIAEILLPG